MEARGPTLPLLIGGALLSGCADPATSPRPPERAPELRDDFEGDGLAPFWRPGDHGTGRYAPGAVVLTDERARWGRRAARITLREGDVAQRGDSGQENERAELDSGRHPLLEGEAWVGWSFLVPEGFPVADVRLVLAQWKQSELEGSPLIAQRLRAGRHTLTVRDWRRRGGPMLELELPPIVPGRWHDMLWHARFGRGADGHFEAWLDGESVARHAGPLVGPGGADTLYHKVGLYRDRWPEPMTLYVDGYALGAARAHVDPALRGVDWDAR